MTPREKESKRNAKTLQRILEKTPKLTKAQRAALENAISLLEARAYDAEASGS